MGLASLLALCGALVLAPSAASAGQARGIKSLQQVLTAARRATPAGYLHRRGSRIISAAAFKGMRAYVLRRYTGVHVVSSFLDQRGQVVDCVPLREQPSLRAGARLTKLAPVPLVAPKLPPRKSSPFAFASQRPLDVRLRRGAHDRFGNVRFCQAGTIPLERVTLAILARFRTLASFFAKGDPGDEFRAGGTKPHPIPPDDATHYYARGVQFVDNLGADAWLNVWSPGVSSHQMSLSQLWVVGSTGSTKQTVEAGWQVYPDKWAGNSAALFIYYTTAGYSSGSGCYNLDCSGFVQVANNVYLGAGFDHYSTSGGTQWGFELQYKRDPRNGNWWLFYRGPGAWIPVGYYPHSLFGAGQLATNAQKIAFGGEDTGQPSALQMGSGQFAAGSFASAAYQNTAFYIDTSVISQWANLSSEVTDTHCYTTDIGASSGSWGEYLFFGGPSCH